MKVFKSLKTFCFSLLLFMPLLVSAQANTQVTGKVVDENNEPIIGATVVLSNDNSKGTITDFDGVFIINAPSNSSLIVSYLGMTTQTVKVAGKKQISIVMKEESNALNELVVVGYGQQTKASVVGAITQTTGKVLERAAGVPDVASALTGNLPGVITTQSSGMPGEEEPEIVIRGASSWNNSAPLILVDGVERSMSSVDVVSVESVSVLKDASATAVYGVKGANGVILITTKRGHEGKANIKVTFNSTVKQPSYLPSKADSYDALMGRNTAIERELGIAPSAWSYITPQSEIEKYRNPASLEEAERYPNIDWQKEIFKDYAMAYNANVSIGGGGKRVKYYVTTSYNHEGDLFEQWDNGRGYDSGYSFDRINVRSNFDIDVTRTTKLAVNLAGQTAYRRSPFGVTTTNTNIEYFTSNFWASAYKTPPDAFYPKYSDGSWGYHPYINNIQNSPALLSLNGDMRTTNALINSDIILNQDLSFVTKGLKFKGMISWDTEFVEYQRGIIDSNNNAQYKWVDPKTGEVTYKENWDQNTNFDFTENQLWETRGGNPQNWSTRRNLNYQLQLNYSRKFQKHTVTAMGLFNRQQQAIGSNVPSYREDWAFRTTYNYAGKYFAEYNGAYNGSEKFSSKNRFAFFNSGAIGWMISEEKFMKSLKFLDMLKVRASYGEIGDDNVGARWLYLSQWSYGGNSPMDPSINGNPNSIYNWYRETTIGNPDIHWEVVTKRNLGVDFAVLDGLFAGNFEYFNDERTDILISGANQSMPSFFGGIPPYANLGRVNNQGWEFELRFNKKINKDLRIWANGNMTHSKNTILERDDPEFLPEYQKKAGYSIGQSMSYIDNGFINNYDQLYGSPSHDINDSQRLPGDYYINDFNGDGIVDSDDQVPYGFPTTPQNTYSGTVGAEWKGLSAFVQFYGVTNTLRNVPLNTFSGLANNMFEQGEWWSSENPNADVSTPRWLSESSNYSSGTQYWYDGSYVRLKNAEIAYTIKGGIKQLGISSCKIYLNGNNIWTWSRMPDDRESNNQYSGSQGAYPIMKRYNVGINVTF